MTIIVGLVSEESGTKRIYLGADSMTTRGWTVTPNNKTKVFEKGGLMWGVAGTVRGMNILENHFDIDAAEVKKGDGGEIQLLIVDALKMLFFRHDALRWDAGQASIDLSVLVAFNHRLWSMGGDFSLIEVTESIAIGSGSVYALGSLHSTVDLPARERVELAVGAASKHDPNCGGVVTILRR